MALKLINETTGREVRVGDKCVTFRSEVVTLDSFTVRRVYCTDGWGRSNEWFPSVIGCEVRDVPDVADDEGAS